MAREILDSSLIHSNIHKKLGYGKGSDAVKTIQEVRDGAENNAVLVVGMRQNPVCKAVQKNLSKAGVEFKYLEYGSYLSQWQRRLAIKMWSGWPTFPMVFVNGVLVGGNHEVAGLLASGEFTEMLPQSAVSNSEVREG